MAATLPNPFSPAQLTALLEKQTGQTGTLTIVGDPDLGPCQVSSTTWTDATIALWYSELPWTPRQPGPPVQQGAYVQRLGGTTAGPTKLPFFKMEDYWDGTGDPVPGMQACLDAAAAAGGIVVSGPTTFTCQTAPQANPNSLPTAGAPYCLLVKSNTTVLMHPAAVITQANGLDAGIVLIETNASYVYFGRFTIDGNGANQTDSGSDGGQAGLYGSAVQFFDLGGVVSQNNIRQGIYISNSSWGGGKYVAKNNGTSSNTCSGFEDDANNECDFFGGIALNNLGAGLRVVGGSSLLDVHVTVGGGTFFGNLYGIQGLYAQGSRIVGVKCQKNTQDGILLQHCDGVEVSGYFDQNTREGIFVDNCTNTTLNAPTCRDNNYGNTLGAVGILLESAANTVINAPRCYDDQGTKSQKYGIQIDNASTDTTVTGGDLTGNAVGAVNDSGTGSTFHNVTGFNPVGNETVAVPASGGSVPATNHDRTFYITMPASGGPAFALPGGPSIVIPASGLGTIRVFAGLSLALGTYTTAPTWVVEGE